MTPNQVSAAAGAGLGVLSYYGLETFALDQIDGLQAQVNLANGNLVVHANELAINSPGLNLKLDRFFNSLATGSGAFGSKGVLSTGQDVGLQDNGSNVVFYGPSGFTATFLDNGGPTYTSPAGINATLAYNSANGTFGLTYNKTGEVLTFSAGGYLTTDTDKNLNAMTYLYDASNNLQTVTDTAGRVTTFGYTSGRLSSITDPAGRHTAYTYTSGNLTQSTNANIGFGSTNYTYNAGNQLTRIKTPANHYVDFSYDGSGRVSTVKRYLVAGSLSGGSVTTTFAYPSSTQTTETDAAAHTTTYTLDSSGRVTAVKNALNNTRSVTWTPNSDVATAVDAMGTGGGAGNTTTYSYDSNNNVTSVATPTGAAARAQYANTTGTNACASIDTTHPYLAKCTEDAQGNQQSMTYDTRGNMTQINDTSGSPNSGVAKSYTYDGQPGVSCSLAGGSVCTSTTGNGNTTTYAYGSNSTLTSVTPPAPGAPTTYTYDSLSRVKTVTDPKGVTITYSYDARDQRTQTSYSTGGSIIYGYNSDGFIGSITDSVGGTETFSYDGLGRETSDTPPGASTAATVTYSPAGNVATYADASGTITYGYDAANQLINMAEPGGTCVAPVSLCTTFAYNANGAQTLITYPGPTTQTTTVDNSGRPTEIKAVYGSTVVSDLTYSYTKSAADTSVVQTRTDKVGVGAPANSVTTYGYDTLGRLTSAAEKTSGGISTETWTYTYDKDGNRTSSSDARPSAGVTAEVAAKTLSTSGTLTSPVFSTSSGSNQLLLALVSSDGPGSGTQTETVTGAGLTWSLVQRANPTGTGTAEIWKATPTTALTNVTVTATQSQSGFSQSLTVEAISGTSGVGASNHSSATTGAPATSLTTTAANSLLFGAGYDPATPTQRTPASGQAITNEQSDTSGSNDQWTQKVQVPVPATGTTVSVGASAPTTSAFNISAVEVKAAAGGATLNQTAGYNAIDELTTLNGSTTALTYDADGNETANPGSATRPGSNYAATASRTETYNGRDQQTGITPTGGNPISNSYLGETNTTQLATTDTITGINTTFSNTMLGIVNVTNSATGSRQLLHTPSGQLIGAHVTAGSSYYLTDNLGSIVGMVDGNQHTQATYSYDPVGNTRSTSGPYPLLSNNPIRYAGGYQPTTGLTKFGARYYDPNTGRFTQPDPSGQEDNPYTYAGDNPINYVDSSGLLSLVALELAFVDVVAFAATVVGIVALTPEIIAAAGVTGLFFGLLGITSTIACLFSTSCS